jgi:hypothetical protein
VEDISTEELKSMVDKEKGEFIMTIAERLRREGYETGIFGSY